MKQWQKISETKATKTSKRFYDEFAPYYFGGRVECFTKGLISTPFKVIDINSAYPYAMTHDMPFGDSIFDSPALPTSRAYTERSFIHIRCKSHGAFPLRNKDKSLGFPNDDIEREYFVTGWEFLAAIETKTIFDWEIINVRTLGDSINFTPYIDHFYAMKAEAEKGSPEYIFAKLFQNALYGKWAADPSDYDEFILCDQQYIDGAEYNDGYEFTSTVENLALMRRPLAEEKHHYYNLATAASITGFVRAYLWRAVCQAGGVHYCDTDSITCEDTGDLELHPTNLGAWDEEAQCDYGAVAGKKLYAFHTSNEWRATNTKAPEWKKANKGVKLEAADIIAIAQGEERTYRPIAPGFSIKQGIKIYGADSLSEKNLDKMFQTRTVRMN
jgi:hypothetical protein